MDWISDQCPEDHHLEFNETQIHLLCTRKNPNAGSRWLQGFEPLLGLLQLHLRVLLLLYHKDNNEQFCELQEQGLLPYLFKFRRHMLEAALHAFQLSLQWLDLHHLQTGRWGCSQVSSNAPLNLGFRTFLAELLSLQHPLASSSCYQKNISSLPQDKA